jgi:hypothetical protein
MLLESALHGSSFCHCHGVAQSIQPIRFFCPYNAALHCGSARTSIDKKQKLLITGAV